MKKYETIGKKTFRYDEKRAIVEFVSKATPEMYADDEEWFAKYGRPLWGIDDDGYIVLDSAGLSLEHWKNRDSRIEYLTEWTYAIDDEVSYLVGEFVGA